MAKRSPKEPDLDIEEQDDDGVDITEAPEVVLGDTFYPKWVEGGGVMEDGDEAGKHLKDLLLIAETPAEEAVIKAGTAKLTRIQQASPDVLGIVLKR